MICRYCRMEIEGGTKICPYCTTDLDLKSKEESEKVEAFMSALKQSGKVGFFVGTLIEWIFGIIGLVAFAGIVCGFLQMFGIIDGAFDFYLKIVEFWEWF